ncbi:MAG: hypothetical protein P4L96_03990 [Rhodoferax sp.]|nr:hypothetical protein [Rhodoferax sp.]
MNRAHFSCWTFLLLALVFHLASVRSWAGTTTPGFTITANNVSLSGQGRGSSQYALTSVNGFAGTVAVVCNGPDPNLYPDLIMPSCAEPTQELVVPANGSISGSMLFYPPWEGLTGQVGRPSKPGTAPLFAGMFAGLGFLGLRLRKKAGLWLALALGAVSLGMLSGAVGCLGGGGLQMTPGVYTYTLSGTGSGVSATGKVTATVHCNTCP